MLSKRGVLAPPLRRTGGSWVSDSQETAWENCPLVSIWLTLEPEHAPELESFALRVPSRVWLLAVLDISCCTKLNSMIG